MLTMHVRTDNLIGNTKLIRYTVIHLALSFDAKAFGVHFWQDFAIDSRGSGRRSVSFRSPKQNLKSCLDQCPICEPKIAAKVNSCGARMREF